VAGAVHDGTVGISDDVEAGRIALREGRWEDARDAFVTSLGAEETPEALNGIADAQWWLCDARASVRYRERAFAGFRRRGDLTAACRAAIDLSICCLLNLGNDAAARGWLARAERLAREDPTQPSSVQGWLWLMQGYVAGDPESAHDLTTRALEFARTTADVDLELIACSDLGMALVTEGDVARGFAMLDEAMAGTLGGECKRLDTVVFASCTMLAACSMVGDLGRATQWCRAAEDFMHQYGCPFLQARCRTHYGAVLVEKGEWERAESELEAALRMAEDAGPGPRNEARTHLARLRVGQGRLESAEALLAQVDDPQVGVVAEATLRLVRNQPGPAVALLRRRIELLGQRHVELAPTLALLVEALVRQSDVAAARAARERLDRLAGDGGDRTRALAYAAQARIAAAEGDHELAVRRLEQALSCYASLGLPLQMARVRFELALLLSAREPELAVTAASQARAVFQQLGAAIDADAASALLRSLGEPTPPGPRESGVLTKREHEVLALVGLGLSNPEIAERLYISRKTAAHHVSNVLAKLGMQRRAELVAYAARTQELTHPR
jgi:ATP/maltotriose-dependent transcriptional regulator MalT